MKKILNGLTVKVKNILGKWTICLIKKLSVLDLWLNRHHNPNPNGYEDLTPTNNGDKDRKYSVALKWALKNKNIKNIALTGAYGSGKSSILRTFEKEHRAYNYLNISLASFSDNIDTEQDDSTKPNIDQLIELSILQQIFYHVNHKKIPDSRFKRIKSIGGWKLFINILGTIIWLLSLILFFSPKFIQETAIWQKLDLSSSILTYLLPTIILLGIGSFIAKSIRVANNSKLNKLNVQSGEIEISKDIDSSILNKHLDEILYFFEVTKYNVVILEDLDRFNNTDIFTKLRELNILVNGSKQINRRVVFIYAIKDDMFHDKNRTKFFDFIIPVIPVINVSNSGDMLHRMLTKNTTVNSLSRDLIDAVSMYIDDMRLLKNICNEYAVYKEKLTHKLQHDNLLAMIIYKNIFPSDFVDLHNGKGKVFAVFENKPTLIKEKINKINTKIGEINVEIREIENVCLKNIHELRAIYIEKIIEKIPTALSLHINSKNCSFADCKTDDNFGYLQEEDRITYYYHRAVYHNSLQTNTQPSNYSFRNIEQEVDTKSYQEREQLIQDKYNNKVEQLKKRIEELKTEKNEIKSWTLQQITEKVGIGDSFENIKDDKLIIYLIRNGYINENYHDYISYFHEGLITKKDREFRFSILNREPLSFDYRLTKVENLVKKIRLNEFAYKEILNCSLIDFLLSKQTIYNAQYQTVLTQICNKSKNSIAFIDHYIEKGQNIDSFVVALCNEWNTFWDFIVLESGYSNDKKDIYLKLIVEYVSVEKIRVLDKNKNISKYLSEKTNFLEVFINEPNIREIIKSLNVKFKSLIFPAKENKLFNFIYENNLYEINQDMVELIIKVFSPDNLEKLKTANYTTIKTSDCKHLINNIENNLDKYISNLFLSVPENTQETEDSIVHLLCQEEKVINLENRKKIIDKQTTPLTTLPSIDEVEQSLIEFIVEKSKMVATWNNVFDYYVLKEEVVDSVLVAYLNQEKNYQELGKIKLNVGTKRTDEFIEKISLALILCVKISDNSFRFLMKSVPYTWNRLNFENLSKNKINWMVSNRFLTLTSNNYNLLKEHFYGKHTDLLMQYPYKFTENQTEYSLDKDDVLALLDSSKFSQKQKTSIIENTDNKLIINSKELSSAICRILSSYQYIELDFDVLKSLIQYGKLENKLKLLNIQLHSLSHNQTTELLSTFAKPYSDIAQKGKKPSIPKNQINFELVSKLQEKGYISSFKEKDDKIKVNTKLL